MRKKIMPYFIIPFALILMGFGLLTAFLGRKNDPIKRQNSEKINLALRQTAHLLLKKEGDSTSMIAPIQKTGENAYFVQLEHPFNYDNLPSILENSFKAHGIGDKYDVAVWSSTINALILGYSSLDFSKNGSVPCNGRNQGDLCYNFTVTFTDLPFNASHFTRLELLLAGFCVVAMALLAYLFYHFPRKTTINTPPLQTIEKDETHLTSIGNTLFDTRHQTISIGVYQQKLTFREAKLLELFCQHKNELLDRDFILEQVWRDEGVLVGRSVDVFVSRLRKILKNDAALKITNVHSRGYRFEIHDIV